MAHQERKSTTILAMDVAGYSAKMSANETETVAQLRICQAIIEKASQDNGGRIFNTAGDAFMIEFPTTIGAVEAAIEIQKKVASHNEDIAKLQGLEFRMGINIGDVTIDRDNLLGDGVNVAARLEGIAPPGGICISGLVHSVVKGKVSCGFIDKGQQNLKNINDPVNAYYADIKFGSTNPKTFTPETQSRKPFNLKLTALFGIIVLGIVYLTFIQNRSTSNNSDYNTIAMLPIETQGKNQEQLNLATGLTQDISGGLTRSSKQLHIVTIGEKPEDLSTIANSANARYILTGQLRQAGSTIRVSINLIDAKSMAAIWSENYDKELTATNLFALQDDVVTNIVDELVGNGSVLAREVARNVMTNGTQNLTAYACVNFVRGQFFRDLSPDLHTKGLSCLAQAVEDDPSYKEAWQLLAHLKAWGYSLYGTHTKEQLSEAMDAVDKAINIDNNYSQAYATRAEVYFYLRDYEQLALMAEKAASLANNDGATYGTLSYVLAISGAGCNFPKSLTPSVAIDKNACQRSDLAFEYGKKGFDLDVANTYAFDNFGLAHYNWNVGEYRKTIDFLSLIPTPGFFWWNYWIGMSHDALGNEVEAEKFLNTARSQAPPNTLAWLESQFEVWNPNYFVWNKPTLLKYGWK